MSTPSGSKLSQQEKNDKTNTRKGIGCGKVVGDNMRSCRYAVIQFLTQILNALYTGERHERGTM